MTLYFLYRGRQWLGALPAVAALAAIVLAVNTKPLNIEPVYDESAVEVALVEPTPPSEPTPAVVEPPPPVEAPLPPPVEEEPEAALPPPKPVVRRPEPKPTPKPVPKPAVAKVAPKPAVQPPPTPAASAPARPAVEPAKPAPAAPVAPRVDTGALEGGYMQGLRSDMERFKQYPTGRQASLERPTGDVVVWMLVDRAGNVLDSGIETPASSMLLNRAASTSLKRIKQVKPFPEQAFGGQPQHRFTATFNYRVQ
ncbi:energy transducer TonB [Pseudomonas sp. S75]|uniref:energy transducer TonB family protein n=1 Tax=unclassified Pseudomonas TaxID=196821 RepID=UPI001906C8AC|nr:MULTISPECIES: energy transducer TonB [unclassified Pseudomonas]MBJ9975517.1 energy transducer TonB [Pseudomonas sp. S30]MBK0153068.1 energy transducer TonB [Pseudomonas sp. S75]